MADDRLTPELEAVRNRIEALRGAWPPVLLTDTIAKDDAPRLLAAVDAVLAEHRETDDLPGFCRECGFGWQCSTVQAITRALTGEVSGG